MIDHETEFNRLAKKNPKAALIVALVFAAAEWVTKGALMGVGAVLVWRVMG